MNPKRLFLFAGYDKFGVVDDALVYYVTAVAMCGDVVLCMDSNCAPEQMKKLKLLTRHAVAVRHGEYDFGSYKRAYLWACENLNLGDYDFVYLVNDSVYGPLFDLMPYLEQMEHSGWNAFGLVKNPHPTHPHIQSWFVGMDKKVFMANWFDDFMRAITKQPSKGYVTSKYEQGLTKIIDQNGLKWGCVFVERGRGVYNHIKKLYRKKMPFMKKVALTRNHGALGRQVGYVLGHVTPDLRNAVVASGNRIYGEKYMRWLITRNPIKIMWRRVRHAFFKLFVEGI